MMSMASQRRSLGSVVWRWKGVLVAALIVSGGIGAMFALSTPPDYESHAQVLIPATDPVSAARTQTSAITLALRTYAQTQLGPTVRGILGPGAGQLEELTGTQDHTQEIYSITARSLSRALPKRAVTIAITSLLDRSNELASKQVERLQSDVDQTETALTKKLVSLRHRQNRLQHAVAAAHDTATRDSRRTALLRTQNRIALVGQRIDGLHTLLDTATQRLIARRAASSVLSGPSNAAPALGAQLVSTIGLAVVVGLAAGFATILLLESLSRWRERRRSRRMRPPPSRRLAWDDGEEDGASGTRTGTDTERVSWSSSP